MKGRQSGMPDEAYWSSFFNPEATLARLDGGYHDGDVVDYGCGYGLFTEAAARGTSGTVYALDIDPDMVEATRRRAARAGLSNVVAEERDFLAAGCGRPDQSTGYAMLFNILHIEAPVALLMDSFRALKPGGKVAILHWNFDPATPRGPSMDIRPRPDQCRSWAEAAGFQFIRYDALECCSYHFGLVVQKP